MLGPIEGDKLGDDDGATLEGTVGEDVGFADGLIVGPVLGN